MAEHKLGIFYDDKDIHTFILTVSDGDAYLLDATDPHPYSSPPIAEALHHASNDEAVRALFDKIIIPAEGMGRGVRHV